MGGFSFHSVDRGPIAWTSIGLEQRRLVLEAMVAADVGWTISGASCPDCMYAHVSRAAAVKALENARLYALRNQDFLKDDDTQWKSGKSSRETFFSIVGTLIEELKDFEDEVVIIVDNYIHCSHPKIESPK